LEEEENYENDLSAQEEDSEERTWFSQKNEHLDRKKRCKTQKVKGQEEINSVGYKTGKLRSGRDFENVFARGRKIVTSRLALYLLPADDNQIKTGICVGKSLANAVKRNRLKRQIREVIRQTEFRREGFYLILVARKSLLGKSFEHLRESIHQILNEANLV
jgi:ribonuclease P protein component